MANSLLGYGEFHCRSNYSFLTAASHPEELVARSRELGYRALALTDECSLAGGGGARPWPGQGLRPASDCRQRAAACAWWCWRWIAGATATSLT